MTEITREDIVVVDTVSNNEYGDLLFTVKGGEEYKISNKRIQYFEKVILPDTAIKLSFAEAHGREYIYRADSVEGELPEKKPSPKEKPKIKQGDSKNGAFSLSYAKDMVVATLSPEKPLTVSHARTVIKIARLFESYLDGNLEISDEEMAKLVMEMNK